MACFLACKLVNKHISIGQLIRTRETCHQCQCGLPTAQPKSIGKDLRLEEGGRESGGVMDRGVELLPF